jgi:hypothetical protein
VERLQCSFEEAIKNMQQRGPPIKLPRASTQNPNKTNLTRNFNSNVENPNVVISKIRNAKMFSVLEEIGQ